MSGREQAKSPYRFVEAFSAAVGYGPALAVTLRETGRVLGYVRRIEAPSERGQNWMVYDEGGKEVGVSDLRSTAANFLRREAERRTPPADSP